MKNGKNVVSVRMFGIAALALAIIVSMTALSLTGCDNGITPSDSETIDSIAVTKQPTRTEYTVGEELDTSGMIVTATYSDGSTAQVTGYTVSGYDKTKTGSQTITVTWHKMTAIFTVTVIDEDDEDEDDYILPEKPVITNQPVSNGWYYQDDPADPLTVTATTTDEDAELTYQWYRNSQNSSTGGTKINSASGDLESGVEGGDFTPPTDTIGVFYYYVEVTSTLNEETAKVTSDVAVIKVIDVEEPVISASNSDPTATNWGENLTLTVEIDDSVDPAVSYQWYSNVENNNTEGTLIPDATEESYEPPTDVTGTMYYYVVVETESGKELTSQAIQVTVGPSPIIVNARMPFITGHPQGATYNLNTAAAALTVTATVNDSGVLSYQWYRNPEGVDEDGYPTGAGERINGATAASYTPPTTAEGTVYYYVVITNTIANNGDGGQKTAQRTSMSARIQVNAQ